MQNKIILKRKSQSSNTFLQKQKRPSYKNSKNLYTILALGWRGVYKPFQMKLSEDLIKKLGKKHDPSTMIHSTFRGNDIAFKTDEEGNAIQLFVGKRKEDGTIKGERFARTLKRDKEGVIFKDHWELKGKAT
ncbi:MAG TPA: hypothetical protein VM888_01580 [Chitinophagaceae bacterium]|nr:hypothetical protein [Chitinophagaceae bacterium]